VLTSSSLVFEKTKLQTCEPVLIADKGYNVSVFQNRMC
jgi:hypothetical protein